MDHRPKSRPSSHKRPGQDGRSARGLQGLQRRRPTDQTIAKELGIRMVEDVPLARALAKDVPIGKPIPTKWFNAVAQVLSQVYKLQGKRPGGSMAGARKST